MGSQNLHRAAALATALALLAGGCSGEDQVPAGRGAPEATKELARLGRPEGRLDLIAPEGYVEAGQSDPAVDWVTGFERQTGCQVEVRVARGPDETVALMQTDDYDGVAVTGETTLQMVAAKVVAPVNVGLVPNYRDVFEGLKGQRFDSVAGRPYGIPVGRSANLLAWRSDRVPGSLSSLSALYEGAAGHAGRIAVRDTPMVIAEAALRLKAAQPDLRIADPYELDERQFQAALALLEAQHASVPAYWSTPDGVRSALARGEAVAGTAPQGIAERLEDEHVPIEIRLPAEGATGSSDLWMVHAEARHPTCMYLWLNHVLSPRVNAQITAWMGEAPANRRACAGPAGQRHCRRFHAADERFYSRVAYWTTPRKECGDARGAVCKDYSEWARAWEQVKG